LTYNRAIKYYDGYRECDSCIAIVILTCKSHNAKQRVPNIFITTPIPSSRQSSNR